MKFLILFFLGFILSNAQNHDNTFIIEGKVLLNNEREQYLFLTYKDENNLGKIDSTLIVDNSFKYIGNSNYPQGITLYRSNDLISTEEDGMYFYIDPGYVTIITLDYSNFSQSIIVGTKTEKENELLKSQLKEINFKEINKQLQALSEMENEANDSMKISLISNKKRFLTEHL